MDDGYDRLELVLPALLTVVKEINEPRVPSLKGKMRAKSQKIAVYGTQELAADPERVGLQGSATQVVKVFPPPRLKEREWIEGTAGEQVGQLLEKLKILKLIP